MVDRNVNLVLLVILENSTDSIVSDSIFSRLFICKTYFPIFHYLFMECTNDKETQFSDLCFDNWFRCSQFCRYSTRFSPGFYRSHRSDRVHCHMEQTEGSSALQKTQACNLQFNLLQWRIQDFPWVWGKRVLFSRIFAKNRINLKKFD